MSRKKRKVDFASLASTSESLLESVDTIKECVSNLKMSVDRAFEMWNSDLDRMLSRCDDKTLEFVLLSRIGLEGIDCLRNGLQMVPPSFLGARSEMICDMVNAVRPSASAALGANECQHLVQVLQNRLPSYSQRKCDHRAYSKEMWELTLHSGGSGRNAFLGPPFSTCIKNGCGNVLLQKHNDICNVTVFDVEGPLPGSKINLRCPRCRTIYSYSKYGNKRGVGERFYEEPREYVEASDVVFVSTKLQRLFRSLRYEMQLGVIF